MFNIIPRPICLSISCDHTRTHSVKLKTSLSNFSIFLFCGCQCNYYLSVSHYVSCPVDSARFDRANVLDARRNSYSFAKCHIVVNLSYPNQTDQSENSPTWKGLRRDSAAKLDRFRVLVCNVGHNDDRLRRLFRFALHHISNHTSLSHHSRLIFWRCRYRTGPRESRSNRLSASKLAVDLRGRPIETESSAGSRRRIRSGSTEMIHHAVFRLNLRDFA